MTEKTPNDHPFEGLLEKIYMPESLSEYDIDRINVIRNSHKKLGQNLFEETGVYPTLETFATELYHMVLSNTLSPYREFKTASPMVRFLLLSAADALMIRARHEVKS